MAQETAGTIGIPVLKNEILPYMADYQRRRDKYAALEAQREAKLADLEYKRQMEREKYVPPQLPSAKGGFLQPAIEARARQIMTEATDLTKQGRSQAEVADYLRQKQRELEAYNYKGEQEKQRHEKNLEQMKNAGYDVDEVELGRFYTQAVQTPTVLDADNPTQFKSYVDADPIRYLNLNKQGDIMVNATKPVKYNYQDGGVTKSFEYNPLFIIGEELDPTGTKKVIRPKGINYTEAERALQNNPMAYSGASNWWKKTAETLMTNNPALDTPTAMAQAKKAYFDAALKNRAGNQYAEVPIRKGRAAGGAEKKAYESVKTPAVTNVTQQRYFYGPDGKVQAAPKDVTEQVDFGITETVIPKKRVNILPNKKVFVLGGNVDDAVKLGFLSKKQSDGSYILRNGFDIETYQKPKEIFRVNNKNGLDFTTTTGLKFNLPNGTILTQRQATNARKKVPNLIKKETQVIRISPGTYQYSEDDMERAKKVGPVLQSLDLIISQDEIPELKTSEKRTTPKQEIQSSGW